MGPIARAFDSDYLDALRQGDPATEAHFVDTFSPILMRALRRKVRSADEVRDLHQETFLRVLAAVRSGRGVNKPERFVVFVFGVCNNILREAYRERSRCVALSELENEPVANFPSAYALVLAEETRSKVHQMLSQLSVNAQTVLEGIFLDEQSKDELCRRLGVTRSYLRVLLYRAKKQLGLQAEKKPLEPAQA